MTNTLPQQANYGLSQDDDLWIDRLAEADEGIFLSAAAVEEWVGSWFTPDELPPPEADLRVTV